MANFRKIGTNFSEGLRTPHYTNGRLLTAEDLQQEQNYQMERQGQLGQAAGYGIVEGLEVSAASNNSALRITAGLGINRKGDMIHLATDAVTLPVQPISTDTTAIRRSARFEACNGDNPDQPATITAGAYLLTASPLAQLEGSVPRQSCDGTSTPNCANQWEVEGVEFKIIRLTNYKPPTGNQVNRNRNLLAHFFYGSDKLIHLMRDPLQFAPNYTGFSQILAADFNECDLPLAVFYWDKNQIAFVDAWAVRRQLIHTYPADKWKANLSAQRTVEGQARYLQFQEHIADLQSQFGSATDTIRAVNHFSFLPPVGILPVNPFELIVADVFDDQILERQEGEIAERKLQKTAVLEQVRVSVLSSLGSSNAFRLENFFGSLLAPQYQIVHEDFIHDRLHQSWVQPPILLPPPATITGNFFDAKLLDGTLMAVNENNFANILSNFGNYFTGTVYTPTATAQATATFTEDTSTSFTGEAATIDSIDATSYTMLAKTHYIFRNPLAIFNSLQIDPDDNAEPLIDIMVRDELLEPYREQLSKEMVGRIDDAITTLAGTGTVFTGSNRYTTINKAVANAFTLNSFLWQGANFGFLDITGLLDLIQVATQPIFYVVFARHRPPIVERPLRL